MTSLANGEPLHREEVQQKASSRHALTQWYVQHYACLPAFKKSLIRSRYGLGNWSLWRRQLTAAGACGHGRYTCKCSALRQALGLLRLYQQGTLRMHIDDHPKHDGITHCCWRPWAFEGTHGPVPHGGVRWCHLARVRSSAGLPRLWVGKNRKP